MTSADRKGTQPLLAACALALAAAVALGLGRFSYALVLPSMRADLGWSYLVAGAMNTANAAGYLAGALLSSAWLGRFGARRLMLWGCSASSALLVFHGLVFSDAVLYLLRFLIGVSSAAIFVAGGLLAARLGGTQAGLVLGIYYGGTGLGIVASTLVVPPLAGMARPHAWQWAWVALGGVALLVTVMSSTATRGLDDARGAVREGSFRWMDFACGLVAYFLFGLGYIGYMTFVVTLLKEEQRMSAGVISLFYGLLGVGAMASSWVWAGMLQRFRGGQPMGVLNGVLAVATVLPVLASHPAAVFLSGLLFGGVFLSVVASTTALVRHNLPPSGWPGGIAAFTIVFAAGQIVGPSLVGWLADGPGGLAAGLLVSAGVLAIGSAVAWGQKPL